MKARQWLTAAVTVEARVHARLMQATMEAQSCRAMADARARMRRDSNGGWEVQGLLCYGSGSGKDGGDRGR